MGSLFPFVLSTTAGLSSFGMGLLTLLVLLFGQNVPATVARHYTYEGESTVYYISCSYSVNGATHETDESVTSGQYSRLREGDPLTVRVLPQLPAFGAQMQLPGKYPWLITVFWLVFSLPWFLPLLVFVSPDARIARFAKSRLHRRGITDNSTHNSGGLHSEGNS